MTAYTPTLTPGSGSFTSATAAGFYRKIGRLVYVEVRISITTNGTAAGWIDFTLPFATRNRAGWTTAGGAVLPCREIAVAGFTTSASAWNNSTTCRIQKIDGTYPGADGYVLLVTGWFEAAS